MKIPSHYYKIIAVLIIIAFSLVILLFADKAKAQNAPIVYWQFENPSPLNASIGGAPFNITAGTAPYTIDPGPVGNCMTHDLAVGNTPMFAANFNPGTSFTTQFIFKPGRNFQVRVNGFYGGFATMLVVGSVSIVFEYPYVILNSNFGQDYIMLKGVGAASWANIQDDKFHMVSYSINGSTGQRRLYIDGQSPPEFIVNGATGTVTGGGVEFVNNGNTNRQFAGSIDEIALYNAALSPNQVWQNYQDFKSGSHYTTALAASVPPYTASFSGTFDPLEYAAGYTVSTDATASVMEQLRACKKPQAKPIMVAADSLPNLIDDADWDYTGNHDILTAVNLNEYWAEFYNGCLSFNQFGNANPADTNTLPGKICKRRNSKRWLKLSGGTYLAQQYTNNTPFDSYNYCSPHSEFPLTYSLTNTASGRHMDENGNICPNWPPPFAYVNPTNKACGCGIGRQPRPTRSTNQAAGFPWSNLAVPGATINSFMTPIDAVLTGNDKIDYIWENREFFKLSPDAVLAQDAVVESDRILSGLSAYDYQSQFVEGCEAAYFGGFIGTVPATTGTMVLGYQNYAPPGYFHNFAYLRSNYGSYNGVKLGSTDDYPRVPERWWQGQSADHGLNWRRGTLKMLNTLYANPLSFDFVSAGWDNIEYKNVGPVQWLGYLKYLGAQGNISFITSFFNNVIGNGQTAIPTPSNYAGTVLVIPAYAHAINTRIRPFLTGGTLMPGDILQDAVNSTDPGYQFNMGDFRILACVRKLNGVNKYAITTALMRNNNLIGNTEDSISNKYLTLNGENLILNVKEQGCTYIYDNTDPSNKVLYQIDKWHEDKHPTRWSSDYVLEAEVNDNFDPQEPVSLKTYLRSGAPLGDYVNSTTAVSYPNTGAVIDSIKFNIIPPDAGPYYGWWRLRSRTGAATSLKVRLNNGTVYTLPVTSTNWAFYRFDNGVVTGPGINYTFTADKMQHLSIIATSSDLEIDQIILTKTPNAGYPEVTSPCLATSTITPSGAVTFCNGSSVTLSANASVAYLWSNGATTQTVNVVSTGTYTVTVTDGLGCTGVSSPLTVTVNPVPATPNVTASGPLTFCVGGSVNLTSNTFPAYLWSTGATTKTITVSTAGSYRVTVTNNFGCTSSSLVKTVVTNPLPAVPTITPSGATTFCSGSSINLTSSAGTTYKWSTGAITSAITVSTSGSYTVTVSNVNGCTNSSVATVVTVNPKPIVASLTPVQNTCPAVTFDLSTLTLVNTGEPITVLSYHATLADANNNVAPIAAVVAATGTYYIRCQAANGCFAVVSQGVTIVSCLCGAPPACNPGPNQTICSGSNVLLAGSITNATVGTWTTSGTGAFLPNATTLNATYVPSAADTVAGTVTLTLTTNNPLGAPCVAASNIMVVTIINHPAAVVTASGPVTFCTGGSVNLAVSVGSSYIWSTGQTTQAIAVSTSGSYKCTVTNSNGCTSGTSNTIVVLVNTPPAAPSVTPSGTTTLCQGGSVTLTASLGTTYTWSNAATTQSISVSTTGNYVVTITNAAGCTASSVPVAVTVAATVPTPIITPGGSTTICQGQAVALTASTADSYLWSNGAVTQTVNIGTTGTYVVTVTVNGCTKSSAGTNIVVNPLPNAIVVNSGSNNLCAGQSTVLTASLGSSYLWNTGALSNSINVNSTGTYIVTVTNSNGCTKSSSPVLITVFPLLMPTITPSGATTFCQPGTVDIAATPGYGYVWSNGKTTATITASTSGNYSVTVMDGAGCTAVAGPIIITANPQPAVPATTPASPINLCVAQSISVSTVASAAYLWSNGATSQATLLNAAGTYSVTVSNSFGCTRQSLPIIVNSGSSVTAIAVANGPTTVCVGTSLTLSASAGSGYLWSNGSTVQTISPAMTGSYFVTVSDAFGCTASSNSISVIINPKPNVTVTTSGSTSICVNGSVQLYVPASTKYLWSNGKTVRSITATNAGNYVVTVTNSYGCTATSIPVTIYINPTCTITCTVPVGMTAVDIRTKRATVQWSNDNNNSAYQVFVWKVGAPWRNVRSTDCDSTKRDVVYLDLLPGTNYKYWMKGYCNGVATDSVPYKLFTTKIR